MRCKILPFAMLSALGMVGVSHRAVAAPGDTTFSGKMYFDITNIDQNDSDSGKTDASGFGIDVKRFYLGVTHEFDAVWSANITTDFNYVGNDGETNLFVKKAYVQGKFSQAAVLRIGSADMPWIPFAESWYGYRYVENTLIDRLKYGASADWGMHLGGDLGSGKAVNYAVSVVNGRGYKNPSRSSGTDFEGRVGFMPTNDLVLAIGAYSGKLGQDVESVSAYHTANRVDALAAYASESLRFGVEYFSADNWGTVLSPASDKADGWSAWASGRIGEKATVFGRYDRARLSKGLDPRAENEYFNVGVSFKVIKGFDLAVAYKQESGDRGIGTGEGLHTRNLRTRELGVWGQVAF